MLLLHSIIYETTITLKWTALSRAPSSSIFSFTMNKTEYFIRRKDLCFVWGNKTIGRICHKMNASEVRPGLHPICFRMWSVLCSLVLPEEETNKHTSRQRQSHVNVTECQNYFFHTSVWSDNGYVPSLYWFYFIPCLTTNYYFRKCHLFCKSIYWKPKTVS